MENRYNFLDIYIFGRTVTGKYVSLSDWYLTNEPLSAVDIKSTSPFIIGFSTLQNREYYVSEITLEELITLAGISSSTNFVKQVKSGVEAEQAKTILALLCSQKILNYPFGRCVKEDGGDKIDFKRRQLVNGKRVFNTVLSKKFRKEMI